MKLKLAVVSKRRTIFVKHLFDGFNLIGEVVSTVSESIISVELVPEHLDLALEEGFFGFIEYFVWYGKNIVIFLEIVEFLDLSDDLLSVYSVASL